MIKARVIGLFADFRFKDSTARLFPRIVAPRFRGIEMATAIFEGLHHYYFECFGCFCFFVSFDRHFKLCRHFVTIKRRKISKIEVSVFFKNRNAILRDVRSYEPFAQRITQVDLSSFSEDPCDRTANHVYEVCQVSEASRYSSRSFAAVETAARRAEAQNVPIFFPLKFIFIA